MRISVWALALALLVTSGSALPGQTRATNQVMREKLAHSERVLEALMTSDFTLLARESAALSAATRAPGWEALETPRYARYSTTFQHAADDLAEAAAARDGDAAMRHYVAMTLSCYQCHTYLKGSRLAR